MATATKYVEREIPQISLRDFPDRIDEIAGQLCDAAENVGFFGLTDHGIPLPEIEAMFARTEAFFRLPADVKATVGWSPRNAGWEDRAQVRPSNVGGAPDDKESYQLQFSEETMHDLWVSDDHLPGFRADCLAFMGRLQAVCEQLMVCLARGLGFGSDDYFVQYHDAAQPDSQSVLRLLHYYEKKKKGSGGGKGDGEDNAKGESPTYRHRAGAHTDWGFLTLLFQGTGPGQGGLEICPGRESATPFGTGDSWTRVRFAGPGAIVCNIGDLLASWSDDRFQSTLHRVGAPPESSSGGGGDYGERFSIAFFCQPCRSAIIQGPRKKHPPVTGGEFIARAMARNFAALREAKLKEEAAASVVAVNI